MFITLPFPKTQKEQNHLIQNIKARETSTIQIEVCGKFISHYENLVERMAFIVQDSHAEYSAIVSQTLEMELGTMAEYEEAQIIRSSYIEKLKQETRDIECLKQLIQTLYRLKLCLDK